ncbi:MAG: hypothetical protein BVN35_09395 [Proteobacteria bacterium ST_bin11]|nr:MAG: hypothetical protein BVN35_09395 [Proteobacteria bacterium ST_bin11]
MTELREQWIAFNRELKQGKLTHLEYDKNSQKLAWRKPKADNRGVAIFAERFFRASQQEKIGKNHATAYACGAPIRPRHLVPTQQGVETSALA